MTPPVPAPAKSKLGPIFFVLVRFAKQEGDLETFFALLEHAKEHAKQLDLDEQDRRFVDAVEKLEKRLFEEKNPTGDEVTEETREGFLGELDRLAKEYLGELARRILVDEGTTTPTQDQIVKKIKYIRKEDGRMYMSRMTTEEVACGVAHLEEKTQPALERAEAEVAARRPPPPEEGGEGSRIAEGGRPQEGDGVGGKGNGEKMNTNAH